MLLESLGSLYNSTIKVRHDEVYGSSGVLTRKCTLFDRLKDCFFSAVPVFSLGFDTDMKKTLTCSGIRGYYY